MGHIGLCFRLAWLKAMGFTIYFAAVGMTAIPTILSVPSLFTKSKLYGLTWHNTHREILWKLDCHPVYTEPINEPSKEELQVHVPYMYKKKTKKKTNKQKKKKQHAVDSGFHSAVGSTTGCRSKG